MCKCAVASTDTYIIKLFDRSVDLARFSEDTPLYPVCRAWMRNDPCRRNALKRINHDRYKVMNKLDDSTTCHDNVSCGRVCAV